MKRAELCMACNFIGKGVLELPWEKKETESDNPGQALENKHSSVPL